MRSTVTDLVLCTGQPSSAPTEAPILQPAALDQRPCRSPLKRLEGGPAACTPSTAEKLKKKPRKARVHGQTEEDKEFQKEKKGVDSILETFMHHGAPSLKSIGVNCTFSCSGQPPSRDPPS